MATNPSAFTGGNASLAVPVNLQTANGQNPVFGAGSTGDTFNRVEMDSNGQIRFGTGALATDTSMQRGGVGVVQFTGKIIGNSNLDLNVAGNGLQVAEGSNAKQGTAVLAAGSAVVANTSVTANSRILLTSNADGGTPGFVRVSARTPGTSFTITSSSGTDTSTIAYEIFEPG